jgi:hypothetical protein
MVMPPKLSSDSQVKQLPNSVVIVWAFAHSDFIKTVAPLVSAGELARIEVISYSIIQKWGQILNGECEDDSVEPLPSFSFLRHCATPMADRYAKDLGEAIKAEFGQETYDRIRKSEEMRLLRM